MLKGVNMLDDPRKTKKPKTTFFFIKKKNFFILTGNTADTV